MQHTGATPDSNTQPASTALLHVLHTSALAAIVQYASNAFFTYVTRLLNPHNGMHLCRSAGCLREALAVASARLVSFDPSEQTLRQLYAASITPPEAAPTNPAAASDAASTPAQHSGQATADRPPASDGRKAELAPVTAVAHAEAAAANLLLLDQPAAAARALVGRAGGCTPVTLHAAARLAAMAAAHKVRVGFCCRLLAVVAQHK